MMSLTQLVLLSGFIAVSLGCSCFPQTQQEKFEKADFAWRLKITSNFTRVDPPTNNTSEDSAYEFDLLTVYKNCFSESPSVLLTGSSGSFCGLTGLKKDTIYIISGTQTGGKQLIDNCNSLVFNIKNRTQRKVWKKLRKSMNARKRNCVNED